MVGMKLILIDIYRVAVLFVLLFVRLQVYGQDVRVGLDYLLEGYWQLED